MIIKINKNGKCIGKVELKRDDFYDDDWRVLNKENIQNVYIDMEQGEMGFTECIDIDLKGDDNVETIEEFFENEYLCDAISQDDKREHEINVEVINRDKDWNGFDIYIDKKVGELKRKGYIADYDIYWRNHSDWDDERVAKVRIHYEDYDE